jgi:hypothetical protein
VRRREVVSWTEKKCYRKTEGFGKELYTLLMPNLMAFLENYSNAMVPLQRKGFQELPNAIKEYLGETVYNKTLQIQTFTSVSLESTDIIRAIGDFHGFPMFSNVRISGEDGFTWYGMVSTN